MKKSLIVTVTAVDRGAAYRFSAPWYDGERRHMQPGLNAQVTIDGVPTWEGYIEPDATEDFMDAIYVLTGGGSHQTKQSDEEAPFAWIGNVKTALAESFSKELKQGLDRIDAARQNLKAMGRDV